MAKTEQKSKARLIVLDEDNIFPFRIEVDKYSHTLRRYTFDAQKGVKNGWGVKLVGYYGSLEPCLLRVAHHKMLVKYGGQVMNLKQYRDKLTDEMAALTDTYCSDEFKAKAANLPDHDTRRARLPKLPELKAIMIQDLVLSPYEVNVVSDGGCSLIGVTEGDTDGELKRYSMGTYPYMEHVVHFIAMLKARAANQDEGTVSLEDYQRPIVAMVKNISKRFPHPAINDFKNFDEVMHAYDKFISKDVY